MVRSIPPVDVDAEALFDDVAAAKQPARRNLMRAVRAEVMSSYADYEAALPEVGYLAALTITGAQKDALRHAYTVETKPVAVLRGDLLDRPVVKRCPFCGIGEAATLDHYLPKELYPEFSILPANLIPSCATCNTAKRTLVVDEATDVRLFLNPCFDTMPVEKFLTVRTRISHGTLLIAFRLQRPPNMTHATFAQLSSHFEQLDLPDRYRRMGLGHLGEKYRALRRAYGPGQEAARVAEKLNEVADEYEDNFGPNFWLVCLYRTLADDDAFCDGGFESVQGHAPRL